jgi:hypothetical protein
MTDKTTEQIRIVEVVGGDAPTIDTPLTVSPTEGPNSLRFMAYWEKGYCGCPDCHCMIGWGPTEQEAIADYRNQWEEKYGD